MHPHGCWLSSYWLIFIWSCSSLCLAYYTFLSCAVLCQWFLMQSWSLNQLPSVIYSFPLNSIFSCKKRGGGFFRKKQKIFFFFFVFTKFSCCFTSQVSLDAQLYFWHQFQWATKICIDFKMGFRWLLLPAYSFHTFFSTLFCRSLTRCSLQRSCPVTSFWIDPFLKLDQKINRFVTGVNTVKQNSLCHFFTPHRPH